MRKPIKSPLYFEARFTVLGKVLQSSMCPHCEQEGEIGLRVARDPSQPTRYDPKSPSTFVDIVGFDPKGAYLRVKPGDWVEADVVCFGYMKRIRASRIEIEGNVLMSGSRKIGRAIVKERGLTVDFLVFKTNLAAESTEELEKVLKRQHIHEGTFIETDCSVDIEVRSIRQQTGPEGRRTSKHRR